MAFFEEWGSPAHFPNTGDGKKWHYDKGDSVNGLVNIDWLLQRRLRMTQAYGAGANCGTSRYSTMTGRYPSRSAMSRKENTGETISWAKISNTKVQDVVDVVDGEDCTVYNLAQVLKEAGYRTGAVGKWHLARTESQFDYDTFIDENMIPCGFETAEAIYTVP
ncbi:Arylsulfatase E [Seminavis robusta]|uniref:Arylsulfatase E n=1 Tax=Seminavis robusta TaxID=568900 RepID=A0A9N8EM00_9STRA|nr:Arylsulfatase E [Seminavis robusta]|eukprot:Sro1200_g251810.1 Arylsulfatase E (163) ;mRNA; f:2198-2686